jgi:hypothetical protein
MALAVAGAMMKPCDCCGNTYDKAFEVIVGNRHYTFDSFACAIHTLAPHCSHCGVPIIGHGMESQSSFYCCAHCARQAGIGELQDRA